ncbi:MAG: hypothetical protein BWY06_02684 [Candidatus Latescibacteria bacterium ADurb.Bin168]|nr:MAG: hypothetical protein BWY06_02684 [Candidatus Latescibacteria bacterium ADurb.Bin168]
MNDDRSVCLRPPVARRQPLTDRDGPFLQGAPNSCGALIRIRAYLLDRFLVAVSRRLIALFAGEYLRINDDAFHAGRGLQRRIPHVAGFLPENRPQKALLGRKFRFTFRRHLPDQDVSGLHSRANPDDAVLIEVTQRLVTHVRNVPCEFFLATLRVPDLKLVFLDVHGREDVVSDEPLAHHNGVLEIVSMPRHECAQNVATQRQVTPVRRRAIGEHLARLHLVPRPHKRTLILAAVLVRPLELHEAVFALVTFVQRQRIGVDRLLFAHDNLRRVHIHHLAVGFRHRHRAGIEGDSPLDARPDKRCLRFQKRNGLPLHVGTHQRTVGIVMLKEGNKRRRRTDKLDRRYIHVVNFKGADRGEIPAPTRLHQIVGKRPVFLQWRVRLRNHVSVFLIRRQIPDFIRNHSVFHHPVRRLDESVLVDPRMRRERHDKTDVLAFRGLDGAHTPVVSMVNVAHLEPGAFPRKTTRPQSAEPPLVRQLVQRVCLCHELAELAGTEEGRYHRRNGFCVHQLLRRQILIVPEAHPLADGASHARKPDGELVRKKLTHRPAPAVPEMVNVIGLRARGSIPQRDDIPDDGDEVLTRQNMRVLRNLEIELLIHPIPADVSQIVPLRAEKEPLNERPRGLHVRRIARTHQLINAVEGIFFPALVLAGVAPQRVLDNADFILGVRAVNFNFLHPVFLEHRYRLVGKGGEGVRQYLSRGGIHNVRRQEPPFHLARKLRRDPFIEQIEHVKIRAISKRAQQQSYRLLPFAVDMDIHDVIDVHRELDPATTVGYDPRGKESLAIGVGNLVKKHAGRPVQLAHDYTLSAVDEERACGGHERQIAKVNYLLNNILDPFLVTFFPRDKPQNRPERRGVRRAPVTAFVDVVFGAADRITDKLKRVQVVNIGNREYALEHLLQALDFPLLRRSVGLKEILKRGNLQLKKVGNIENCGELGI